MTTLTIKTNEKTKAGKAFMEMTEAFFKDAKGIEIIETPNATTLKAINDAPKKIGLTKAANTKDLLKNLRS